MDVSLKHLRGIKKATWHDVVQEKDSFLAGVKFQQLIDDVREEYIKKHKVYDHSARSMFTPYALQLHDDLLLYDRITDNATLISHFNDLHEQELKTGIKELYLRTWHKALQRYLQNPRTKEDRFKFFKRCAKKRFRLSKDGYFYETKRSLLLKVNGSLFDSLEDVVLSMQKQEAIKQKMLSFYEGFMMHITNISTKT